MDPFTELWHRAEEAYITLAHAEGAQDADYTRLDLLVARQTCEADYESAVGTLDILWDAYSRVIEPIRYHGHESGLVLTPIADILADIAEAAAL